jgi:hypothetical protein
VTADFNKKIKAANQEVRDLHRVTTSEKELRQVPVSIDYEPKKMLAKIYRDDTGELVETRSMTKDEMQRQFEFSGDGKVNIRSLN